MIVYLLIFVNIVLAVLGQTIIKLGVTKIGVFTSMPLTHFILRAFLSYEVLTGLFLYLLSAVLWFMVLSKVQLSIAYPALSFGYVLVVLVGFLFLGEPLSLAKLFGTLLICAGIFFIFQHQ